MLVVGMLRVEGEERDLVPAGELFEDIVAADLAAHVGGKQASSFANAPLRAGAFPVSDGPPSELGHDRSEPSHDREGVVHRKDATSNVETLSPWLLARIPAFWWIAGSGAIVNFMLYSFSLFLPAFLTRYHGLSVARSGVWSGVGSGAAGVLGALAAGYLGDRAR